MTFRSGLDPASAACLTQTRSAVMSILVLDGLLIAISGVLLRGRGVGITLWPPDAAYRWSHLALLALMFVGSVVRLLGTSRPILADPGRRARRFFLAHVAGALFGTLALPIGFAYGWAVRPSLTSVGPFWAVALVLGLLSLPRVDELIGFESPMLPRRLREPVDHDHRDSPPPQSRPRS